MSRIAEVLRNKNKIERREKKRKEEETRNIKIETSYRVNLLEELKEIDKILDKDNVQKVVIEIDKDHIQFFMKSILNEDLEKYDIKQVNEKEYEMSYKTIDF